MNSNKSVVLSNIVVPIRLACFASKSKERNTHGFTLIELLVVVLIIGILAAVAVPQYKKAVRKAQDAKMIALINTVVNAQKVYYTAYGDYADSFDKLDLDLANEGTCPSISIARYEVQDQIRVQDYCLYLTKADANNVKIRSVFIGWAKPVWGLPLNYAKYSGYEYLFVSNLSKRPANALYCREQSFYNSPGGSRKDFHCSGELINQNNCLAWFKMP